MLKHRYAFENKQLVDIFDRSSNAGTFICPGCKEPMHARAMGKVRIKHFAHMPGSTAGRSCQETYLHIISKVIFRNAFRACVREVRPFLVSYNTLAVCPFSGQQPCYRPCSKQITSTLDLTSLFDDAVAERKDGPFVPDLLLFSNVTDHRCYVEIFVSSPVSEAKKASGIPVLEISVQNEAAVDMIDNGSIDARLCQVYSFGALPVPSDPFECQREKYAAAREMEIASEQRERLAQEHYIRIIQDREALSLSTCSGEESVQKEVSYVRMVGGHRINIIFDGSVWIFSFDRRFHSKYKTREEAEARADRLVAEKGLCSSPLVSATLESSQARESSPDELLQRVIAVFGGRILDDNEP